MQTGEHGQVSADGTGTGVCGQVRVDGRRDRWVQAGECGQGADALSFKAWAPYPLLLFPRLWGKGGSPNLLRWVPPPWHMTRGDRKVRTAPVLQAWASGSGGGLCDLLDIRGGWKEFSMTLWFPLGPLRESGALNQEKDTAPSHWKLPGPKATPLALSWRQTLENGRAFRNVQCRRAEETPRSEQ